MNDHHNVNQDRPTKDSADAHPERMSLARTAPELFRTYAALDQMVQQAVEPALHELVKIRASQLNGCAFCLDMHTTQARAQGESEQRLHLLSAWRHASAYTERERAALALTEAITLIAETHVPDEVWNAATNVFSPEELAGLLMAIVTINGWNRIAVSSRTPAGGHQPDNRARRVDAAPTDQ
ncbi:MAG TPA: carboxymuconolactone decarboxylase family protein [Nocardioidaceae bacterium]|jgi:AhpD family alkylhydroperoxidase|nr:carboxymuconolactone decarboxylase family protein [Nocardioidaceae bacterium]